MTYTPSSAINFIEHFENTVVASAPFYYEASSNTINFGYGINLTALATNAAVKTNLITWFNNNGIVANTTTVAGIAWSSIVSVTASNGTSIANSLNTNLTPGNYTAAANSITTSYVNTIVISKLTAKITNFNSLPATTQLALEAMYYNGPGTLGSKTYGAAKSYVAGNGKLAVIAEQLAFNANKSPDPDSSGAEERYIGSALLAMGIIPTYNTDTSVAPYNEITSINASGANKNDIEQFLKDVLNPDNVLGSGGVSAATYVSKWGYAPAASYQTILTQLEQYAKSVGVAINTNGNDVSLSVTPTSYSIDSSGNTIFNSQVNGQASKVTVDATDDNSTVASGGLTAKITNLENVVYTTQIVLDQGSSAAGTNSITATSVVGGVTTSEVINTASASELQTDDLQFESNTITGNIAASGYVDQYGRKFTLSGTILTITGKTAGDSLTISNFVNGDFGVTMNAFESLAPLPFGATGINSAGMLIGTTENASTGYSNEGVLYNATTGKTTFVNDPSATNDNFQHIVKAA